MITMQPEDPEPRALGEGAPDGGGGEPGPARLASLRSISPLIASEQDWVDSDFVAARIWTE